MPPTKGPMWLAVFTPATRQKHTPQELMDFMHSYASEKRPFIERMLKAHDVYVKLTGHDLHDKSLDGVNAYKVKGFAERLLTFPFNEHKVKLFADMYEGAALLHSKKNFVEICLKEPTNASEHKYSLDTFTNHTLATHPRFSVMADADDKGVVFALSHKPSIDGSYSMKTVKNSTQPMAFVVQEEVRFNLAKDFETTEEANYSWQELEQDFGITKDMFEIHSVATDDPFVALKGAYKAVHSQEVHEIYHMDFSESDK